MAPLSQALQVEYVREDKGVQIFRGNTLDKMWVVIKVPQGGYTLGLIIEAAISMQSLTKHKEIIHVTAHFLRSTTVAPYEIHIRHKRTGKQNTILAAEFIQKDTVRIISHLIFKDPSIAYDPKLTLPLSSPLSRRIPLSVHPSASKYTSNKLFFHDLIRRSETPMFVERNMAKARGENLEIGGGVLEWGAWVQFMDPSERIKPTMLPFLADIVGNLPSLLPEHMRPDIAWHPTMFLSLEYKFPILDNDKVSKRTVGIYTRSTFMLEGRHDVYAEVWTAPSNISEGVEVEGWQKDQVCLAISHQMALAVPPGVNERKANEAKM